MMYPPAPWTLKGFAFQTLQLTDVQACQEVIPPDFEILNVWPGKAMGGVYLSRYEVGSTLEYSELIVVPAFVRYGGKIGGWISHIYVDSPASVAGGREVWGLPKELADFAWDDVENRVVVRQNDRVLCSFSHGNLGLSWTQSATVHSFGLRDREIVYFDGDLKAKTGFVRGQLDIPPESPFASLGLDQPWLVFGCDRLQFTAQIPQLVGQRAAEFSYR